MKILFFSILFNFLTYIQAQNHKYIFGSCANFLKNPNSTIFKSIYEENPEYFIWLGDAAYIDYGIKKYPGFQKAKEIFQTTKQNQYYQKLLKKTKILGIWDDHDFGINDGNKNFPFKQENKQIYLDFLDEPLDSQRRNENNDLFFEQNLNTFTKLILIDVRWEKNSYSTFGNFQLKKIRNSIINSELELYILGFGIQFTSDDRFMQEMLFQKDRENIFQIIDEKLIQNKNCKFIFISGDVHWGEILKVPEYENLYEFTSSGLTHYRENILVYSDLLENIQATEQYSLRSDRLLDYNYGVFIFEQRNITVQLKNIKKEVILQKQFNLDNFNIYKKQFFKRQNIFKSRINNILKCLLFYNWKIGTFIILSLTFGFYLIIKFLIYEFTEVKKIKVE